MTPWGSQLAPGQRVIVLGVNETGKSHLAEELTTDAARVLWLTPEERDYARPGRLEVSAAELRRWPALLRDPHLRIVVRLRPEESRGEGARKMLEGLREQVREAGNLVWVLDEVGDLNDACEEVLRAIFRRDRHRGVTTLMLGQTLVDIPLRCRKLASSVLCLGQSHEGELELLAQTYGEEFAAKVRGWKWRGPPIVWRPAFAVQEEP